MKVRPNISALLAAGCVMAISLPSRMVAEISDEDFKALKEQVQQLSGKVQKLEQLQQQLGKAQETASDAQEKARAATKMGKKVQQLEEQVGETQKTVAEGKAVSGAQVQPIAPVAAGPLALHNFVITGDAEVQFGKTQGQHSAFTLADFAPIFLFRANDNILFEAGFDVRLQNGSVTLLNGQTGNSGSTTTISLSFATLDYMLNDYVKLVAGDMLLPLGP